jgi:DNA polymerase III alpha subunit (gram-positive type)
MPIEMSDYWPRIFQLSWLITDQNGITLKEKNCLIKPDDFIIPNEMAERHGITTDVARKFGTNLNVVLLELLKDIQSAKAIVGHNINYDMKVICAEFYRLNYNFIYNEKKIYCTMKSGMFISEMNNKWPKLQELHKELFGHAFKEAHNAMSDVNATKVCFWEMVKQHKIIISDKSEDDINTDLPF